MKTPYSVLTPYSSNDSGMSLLKIPITYCMMDLIDANHLLTSMDYRMETRQRPQTAISPVFLWSPSLITVSRGRAPS